MKKKLYKAKRSFDKAEITGQLLFIEGNAHIIQDCDIEEDGHHFHQISDMPTWVDEDTIEEVDSDNSNDQEKTDSENILEGYESSMLLAKGFDELRPKEHFYMLDESNGNINAYLYVCQHPLNNKYILTIKDGAADAVSMYIPSIVKEIEKGNVYIGKSDMTFFFWKKLQYHQKKALQYKQYIEHAIGK